MKAKVTYIGQDNDIEFGYCAFIHYSSDTPKSFFEKLDTDGYTFDFPEESGENGYDESMWVFEQFGGSTNKVEFMQFLRKAVKAAK